MGTYAHWLEGEYLKLARRLDPSFPNFVVQRDLKIRALFGANLALSDVQVIDSNVLLHLFQDQSFRNFLRDNPDFCQLIARPSEDHDAGMRFSIATAGLRRTLAPGWLSSNLPDPQPIIDLAGVVVTGKRVDQDFELGETPGTIGELYARWPKYRQTLAQIVNAVRYFALAPGARISAAPSQHGAPTYYDMLHRAAESRELSGRDREYVEKTIHFVDLNVEDPKERGRRSLVLPKLDTTVWPIEDQVVWHTIAQAWNSAVGENLGAAGDAVGQLPYSAPVGIYFNKPVDMLAPLELREGKLVSPSLTELPHLAIFEWDPGEVSWEKVRQVVADTRESAETFQCALALGDDVTIKEALETHAQALAGKLTREPRKTIPEALWYVGGGVALWLGQPLAAGMVMGGRLGYRGLLGLLQRISRWYVVNTLRVGGERMWGEAEGRAKGG